MQRILIIEDDDNTRNMMKLLLEIEGFEVIDAANGWDGVEMFRLAPTDYVITDIIMPKKGGLNVIDEISRDYPDVIIIAISGGGMIQSERYLDLAKKIGAHRILKKPVSREKLLEAMNLSKTS